jgi:hypothetical protein
MATAETEYEQVYQGIVAVAARCDGARTEDGVGFNGQDTHFGRRIASVPFSEWTQDVMVEAARIANTYQVQILSYTGINVTTLQVVQEAKGIGTNHTARDTARGYERKAQGASQLEHRKIDVVDGELSIFFSLKDPEKAALLDACRALPNRHFSGYRKCWQAPMSDAFADFVLTWDFPITDEAQALMSTPIPEFFNVTLADNGTQVVIDTPYDAALVERIKGLPGRSYVGGSLNRAAVDPAVVTLVIDFGLKIHPDARSACERAQEALEAKAAADLAAGDLQTLMAHVSRLSDPTSLPPAFLELLQEVMYS